MSCHLTASWLSPPLPPGTCASPVPTKLKIFSYLADSDRPSSRANLFFKGCAPSDACERCGASETGRHIFFDCSLPRKVWRWLDVDTLGVHSVWDLRCPDRLLSSVWLEGVAVLLWTLWKARNDLVFNSATCSCSDIFRRCVDDLVVWSC